jgi:hypothetical protein
MMRSAISRHLCIAVCSFSAAVAFTGCGDDGYSGPTGTVSGTVTMDGTALSTPANVTFMNAKKGFTASGQTDASGKFSLITNESPDIPVGTYDIAVTPVENEEMTPEQAMEASMNSEDGSIDSKNDTIPAKYGSPGSSGLSFEVKEGENTAPVELKSE